MTTRLARTAALVGVAVALTGCVRVTSTNTFSDHDTVTQDTIIALAPDAASQLGIDLDTLTAAAFEESGQGVTGVDPSKVTITDYTDGDLKGVHIVATDLTLDEFNAAAGASAQEVGAGLGTTLTVERDGDDYVVTIPADPQRDLSDVRGAGSIGLLGDSIDVSVRLTFPGPVRSASAGDVNGKSVTLGLEDLMTPDEIVVRGQATNGIAWTPILRWAGLIGALVVIVGGAAFLVWQDHRKRAITSLPPIPSPDDADPADADAPEEGTPPGQ